MTFYKSLTLEKVNILFNLMKKVYGYLPYHATTSKLKKKLQFDVSYYSPISIYVKKFGVWLYQGHGLDCKV